MGRPRKYSDEFRRRAVDEVLERGRKVGEVVNGQFWSSLLTSEKSSPLGFSFGCWWALAPPFGWEGLAVGLGRLLASRRR